MNKKIIGVLFVSVFMLTLASATLFEVIGKTETCNLLNISGVPCDQLWCSEVVGCNYSLSKEVCVCYEKVNITNETIAMANLSGYYNKTQIDILVEDLNDSIQNVSFNETKEFIEDKFKNMTLRVDSKLTDLEYDLRELMDKGLDIDPMVIILVILIIAVGVLVAGRMKPKSEKTFYEQGKSKEATPKIKKRQDLENEEEITRLKKQIEEFKKETSEIEEEETDGTD